jgi:hypothetical protein
MSIDEKVTEYINDMTLFFKQYITKKGALPVTIFLFDDKGQNYAVPVHELEGMMMMSSGKMHDVLVMYIKYLAMEYDVTITRSCVLETIMYANTDETEETNRGFMVISESINEIDVSLYGIDHKNRVYKEPIEEMTFDKSTQRFNSPYAHIIQTA